MNLGSVGASQTSAATSVSIRVNNNPTAYSFTITTVTDYGWTTESATTAAITC